MSSVDCRPSESAAVLNDTAMMQVTSAHSRSGTAVRDELADGGMLLLEMRSSQHLDSSDLLIQQVDAWV